MPLHRVILSAMAKIEELISQKVKEFLILSDLYCQWVEESGHLSSEEFFEKMLNLFPKIYLRALSLPQIEVMYSADEEQLIGDREIRKIGILLKTICASRDSYPTVGLNPSGRQYMIVRKSLSESLSDLYLELKNFSLWYKQGTLESMNDSIKICADHFSASWGIHLVEILRVLHEFCFVPASADLLEESLEESAEESVEDEDFDPEEMEDFSEEKEI